MGDENQTPVAPAEEKPEEAGDSADKSAEDTAAADDIDAE